MTAPAPAATIDDQIDTFLSKRKESVAAAEAEAKRKAVQKLLEDKVAQLGMVEFNKRAAVKRFEAQQEQLIVEIRALQPLLAPAPVVE